MTTVARKKRGRPKDTQLQARRREQILDAAAAVFAQHGMSGTDLQCVADALQIAKGTIYRYFPSKERLFLAAVDRGMCRLREQVESSRTGVADPLEQIARAVHAYLAFFKDHPQYVELLIQERAEFKDRRTPTYFVHRDAARATWRDLYRGLIAAGRVRDIPPDNLLDLVGNLVYGTMFTNYFTGQQRPVESQAREVLDLVFHGILTETEQQRQRGS